MHCQLVIRVSKSVQLSKLTVINIKRGNLSSNLCYLPHLNKHVIVPSGAGPRAVGMDVRPVE